MKKLFFATWLLTLLGVATMWAQFTPEVGVKYVLKENSSGLYLDIQTLGINEPNAGSVTNNISLNAAPRAIFFGVPIHPYCQLFLREP